MADDTGLIDQMANEDVSVPHKAMVTETNQEWTLDELVSRIADEHAVMTGWMDLWNLTETVKDLNKKNVYGGDADAWNAFTEALEAAKALLEEDDEDKLTEDALKNKYDVLKAAAQSLTADADTTNALKKELNELTGKADNYSESGFGKNSNWEEFKSALEEANAALASDTPVAGAMKVAADRLTKVMNKLDRVADRQDAKAATAVTTAISALPDLSKISLSDEKAVMDAKAAYDDLTQSQKDKIDEKIVNALNEAVKKINDLKTAQSVKKITPVVTLSKTVYTYSGKVINPSVTVKNGNTTLKKNTDYTVTYARGRKNAGTYKVTVTCKGNYSGSAVKTFKINKAANPLKIKAKTATVKYSKVRKKAQSLAVSKVITFTKKGQGRMTYTKASGNKKIAINKTTGKVTVKKGLKKGTYKVKARAKAAGNANYKASAWKTVAFKVKVK